MMPPDYRPMNPNMEPAVRWNDQYKMFEVWLFGQRGWMPYRLFAMFLDHGNIAMEDYIKAYGKQEEPWEIPEGFKDKWKDGELSPD